jgi:hypothetical protein
MLTRIEVPGVSGISGVPWDAVELVLGRQHFIQQRLRQRLTGLVVARDERQRIRLPGANRRCSPTTK